MLSPGLERESDELIRVCMPVLWFYLAPKSRLLNGLGRRGRCSLRSCSLRPWGSWGIQHCCEAETYLGGCEHLVGVGIRVGLGGVRDDVGLSPRCIKRQYFRKIVWLTVVTTDHDAKTWRYFVQLDSFSCQGEERIQVIQQDFEVSSD